MTRSKRVHMGSKDWQRRENTYDCALLEPLALPPDLPPVILNVGFFLGNGNMEVVDV